MNIKTQMDYQIRKSYLGRYIAIWQPVKSGNQALYPDGEKEKEIVRKFKYNFIDKYGDLVAINPVLELALWLHHGVVMDYRHGADWQVDMSGEPLGLPTDSQVVVAYYMIYAPKTAAKIVDLMGTMPAYTVDWLPTTEHQRALLWLSNPKINKAYK